MFNLKQKIADWRREMIAAGVTTMALDELESHLHDEFEKLRSSGITDREAFDQAMTRIGQPRALKTEFDKTTQGAWNFLTIATVTWVLFVGLAATLVFRHVLAGRLKFDLGFHIFTLTSGYTAALLAGCFGIFYICCQTVSRLTPSRQRSVERGILRFSRLAVLLIFVGLICGMIWSKRTLGNWWMSSPREVGALLLTLWMATTVSVQKLWPSKGRTLVITVLGGNVLTGLAWFGASMLTARSPISSYWPLAVFVAMHLVCASLAILPRFSFKRA